MSTLLKDAYDKSYIQRIIAAFKAEGFDLAETEFEQLVFAQAWAQLELKARTSRICQSLASVLPCDAVSNVELLCRVAAHFNQTNDGYLAMFLTEYIEANAQRIGWGASVQALARMTAYASAEFAVRPFIIADQQRMLLQMQIWAKSDNEHLRRLASEGCRPRLPWAQALPVLKLDPEPLRPILDALLEDQSLYVRRSVANNLNDISKDNPDWVLGYCRAALAKKQSSQSRDHVIWLVKHACRGLLKAGDPRVLSLFGYDNVDQVVIEAFNAAPEAQIGDRLDYAFTVRRSDKKALGKIRIELLVDYVKANGKTSSKCFKLYDAHYQEVEKRVERHLSLKQLSTRKHYPGMHKLTIRVNGVDKASRAFELRA